MRKVILLSSQCVYVVDDDREVRSSISFMLAAANVPSRPFASGIDFLDDLANLPPGSILLDLRMPQMDGFELMAELQRRQVTWPVIVMTGHGEVSVAVRAMKLGAVDFLEKPFSEEALMSCFEHAFPLLEQREADSQKRRTAVDRIQLLTAREREVLQGLLAGGSNKLIAQDLGISLRTVEMHRGNMMDRLQVDTLAEAVALALQAGLEPARAAAAADQR